MTFHSRPQTVCLSPESLSGNTNQPTKPTNHTIPKMSNSYSSKWRSNKAAYNKCTDLANCPFDYSMSVEMKEATDLAKESAGMFGVCPFCATSNPSGLLVVCEGGCIACSDCKLTSKFDNWWIDRRGGCMDKKCKATPLPIPVPIQKVSQMCAIQQKAMHAFTHAFQVEHAHSVSNSETTGTDGDDDDDEEEMAVRAEKRAAKQAKAKATRAANKLSKKHYEELKEKYPLLEEENKQLQEENQRLQEENQRLQEGRAFSDVVEKRKRAAGDSTHLRFSPEVMEADHDLTQAKCARLE